MLDKTKLPKLLVEIVDNYLSPVFPRLTFEVLSLYVLHCVSKILCWNHVKIIQRGDFETFPNTYILIAAESGIGKDSIMAKINTVMSDCENQFEKEWIAYQKRVEEWIKGENGFDTMLKKSPAKAKEIIESGKARGFVSVYGSDASVEGVAAQRIEMKKAGMGCGCWYDFEIMDTLSRAEEGTEIRKHIDYEKAIFDLGDSPLKLIKGTKMAKAVKAIPHVVLLQGEFDPSRSGRDTFKTMYESGGARRNIVGIMERKPKDKMKDAEKSFEQEEFVRRSLFSIYKTTKPQIQYKDEQAVDCAGYFEYHLTEEANKYLKQFDNECDDKADLMPMYAPSIARKEQRGRWWLALKVAGCFESMSSTSDVISLTSLQQAISFVNETGGNAQKLLGMKMNTIGDDIIMFLRDKINQGGVAKCGFYGQAWFPRKNQSRELTQGLEIANDILSKTNEIIMPVAGKNNAQIYKIESIPDNFDTIMNIYRIGKTPSLDALCKQYTPEIVHKCLAISQIKF